MKYKRQVLCHPEQCLSELVELLPRGRLNEKIFMGQSLLLQSIFSVNFFNQPESNYGKYGAEYKSG